MDERKAAHVATAFVLKEPGRTMDKLKLTKLIYLAERESLKQRGFPMIYDIPCSMPHGPVMSTTLNHTNYDPRSEEWAACLKKPKGNTIRLLDGVGIDGLRRLSQHDTEIIDSVWNSFGHYSAIALRSFTHGLAEYNDPGNSSRQMEYTDILLAVGYSEDVANDLADDIEFFRKVDRLGT